MVIWKQTPGPYGLTSTASTPFAEKAFRVRQGRLVDATPEFCSRIFSDEDEDYRIWGSDLTPDKIKRLQTSAKTEDETEEVVSALLSRALQHVFCRQFDDAMRDLNLWPEAGRTKMEADFAESIQHDYPEFADRLLHAM